MRTRPTMRATLSIVLAGLVVMVPLQQVQAQAEQQEAVGLHQVASPDSAAHLLRVQPLTENGALLWGSPLASVEPSPGADELMPMPMAAGVKAALLFLGFFVVLGLVFVVVCVAADACLAPSLSARVSPGSSHSGAWASSP